MTFIGIDPGKNGALAAIDETSEGVFVLHVIPFDEALYNCALLGVDEKNTRCALEKVGAMPKQGVSSTWSFAENYGFIRGLLRAHFIPHELIPPQKWKKAFGATADKSTSIDVARRLFPEVDLKRTSNSRKDDDGMAEALLLAEYARRTMGGAK